MLPGKGSSTRSRLHDFLPEEQLATTEQVLRTILGDLQSHDQAPLLALHTLRSLSTSFLREPHTPAKLKDILHSFTSSPVSAFDLVTLQGPLGHSTLPTSRVTPQGPLGTSTSTTPRVTPQGPLGPSPSTGLDPCSQEKVLLPDPGPRAFTGSQLHDFLPEEQLAAEPRSGAPARSPHPPLPHHQFLQ